MPSRPSRLQHLVWQAYGKERQYTVLVNETHSSGRVHSLPAHMDQSRPSMSRFIAHVHHIVKYNKRCTLCFCFIPNTNLPNAPVTAEEVIKIFSSDLVVEVLDKENAIRAGWKLRLCGLVETQSSKTNREARTVGRGAAILYCCHSVVSCK